MQSCQWKGPHPQDSFFDNPLICQRISQHQGVTSLTPAFSPFLTNMRLLANVERYDECVSCILTASCGKENQLVLLVLSGLQPFGNEQERAMYTTIMAHLTHEPLSEKRVTAYKNLLLAHADELSFFPSGTKCQERLIPLD